ncbi:transcriptional regulator SlyA [Halomonas shantousis]
MLKEYPSSLDSLGLRLGHVHRLWRMVVDHTVAPLGLTQPRWTALIVLRHLGEGATQKRLADSLGIELSSLSRTLEQLERQGLVHRCTSAGDRRAREVWFTPEGRHVLAELDARANEARARLLEGIPEQERDALLRVLSRIESNADEVLGFS